MCVYLMMAKQACVCVCDLVIYAYMCNLVGGRAVRVGLQSCE